TAKVRVQSSTTCNVMKLDAFCLRTVTTTGKNGNELPFTSTEPVTELFVADLQTSLSPNPATNYVNLGVRSNEPSQPVQVKVVNAFGAVVYTQKINPNSTLRITTDQWKPGVYFIEVTQGDRRRMEKLVRTN
ncbi:MAG TPA: T9SS type A sorting domain-containing protein, partial [Ferruginibacter sp.]|nr:T9SS type A sorting domain-containing protein [Ferruginibacter sp.]